MKIPKISKATIQQHTQFQSYQWGEKYNENDAVLSMIEQEKVLYTEVEEDEYEPCSISISFDKVGVIETHFGRRASPSEI